MNIEKEETIPTLAIRNLRSTQLLASLKECPKLTRKRSVTVLPLTINAQEFNWDWSRYFLLVRLGKSGLKVSKIILGTMQYGDKKWQEWVLDEEEATKHIKVAYDIGNS